MHHNQKQAQHQGLARLRYYLQQVLLGGGLIVSALGCQSVSTTTYSSVDQVEISNAWKDSGKATQRYESSYREAWRTGYIDGRQGKPQNFEQHKPAQFEAFQQHLRQESREEWRRGYADGHASATQLQHQGDPYGHHQQLFASPNPPTNDTPPSREFAPADLNPPAPHFYNPNLDSGETAPQEPVPSPILSPPVNAPQPTAPPTPETKPKYIDEDRVAGSWSSLNAAIERTVTTHDGQQQTQKSTPQVVTNNNFSNSVPASPASNRSHMSASIGQDSRAYQIPLNPTYNPQTRSPEGELQIQLPKIDVPETFGLPRPSDTSRLNDRNDQPNSPPVNHPGDRSTSADEVLDLPALELGHYQTTPMGRLESTTVAKSKPAEEVKLEPAPTDNSLQRNSGQKIATADTVPQANQRVGVSMDPNSDATQSVNYELTLDQSAPNLHLPPLQEPKSPIVSTRQLIRDQLPSRLPLRPRK